MSYQPPSIQPPPPGIPIPPPVPPARRGFLDQFKGLTWWQTVLVIFPLTLIFVGGLVGGVVGVLGALGSLKIARGGLSTSIKVVLMIGIGVLCYALLLVIAGILYAMTHP
jgi:hypothetical protein